MKIKGFLQDVTGASRVTKARLAAFENASPVPVKEDPISETRMRWHPGKLNLTVKEIRDASITAKTFRFVRSDGGEMPFFYAGQFMVLDFPIGTSLISRPYSISSAPCEARGENGYVEITVRRSKGDGFIADYLNDEVKVGDTFDALIGCGQFYYEPLRDADHVVALAGGAGITPFASMAKEIAAGKLDMDLTILFGSVSSNDIILKEELEALKSDKLHIVHVLSGDEPDWQGERGFLTADLIKKYSAPDTSYFICGPQVMYTFLRKELEKMDIPARRVRFEVFGQAKDVTKFAGYPKEIAGEVFKLTVRRGIHEDVIPARADESLVVALERAGIRIETGCRSGECGFCRSKVVSGQVFISPENDGRRAADKDFGYVHACAAYPLSDVTIKIPIA
ncbi:MAG: iron-sulfur cluster-binding domain-containing protein, partial [Lachnospiraceae bacterium]|nr:iron-sulfur cluster-binding domain-containing protein [Lachnospiraceae bacterium]